LWTNLVNSGRNRFALSSKRPASNGDSRPHFTQRIQRGNGFTGTPMYASAEKGSTSSASVIGGMRKDSTWSPSARRTLASSRASWMGWHRLRSQRSMPIVTTERFGRSTSEPGP